MERDSSGKRGLRIGLIHAFQRTNTPTQKQDAITAAALLLRTPPTSLEEVRRLIERKLRNAERRNHG
ncbi:TPA: hypothetical protein HA318_06145 [Candidatus Micrarchaeota archaeon]|nr:MAG: hypothetical protein AUJ65_03800 [Candidatus Micrarchaeota archaeon CG1_02_51_15]HII39551.1 hypothetical protein [Candidatus Micrarchaeota archaeon]